MDAEDNREDLDYEEEMEGINNPSNSPLSSANDKVMKAPCASTENPKVHEKQIPEIPVTATPDPSPVENPTTVNESIPTEDTSMAEA